MKIAKLPTAKRESVKCFKKSLLFGILFRVGLVIIILFFGWTIWQYKPLWNFVKSLAPDPPLHGIGISSGCANPTRGGQPLVCFVSLQNTGVTDTAHDTLMVRSLVQVIHAASGDISSGNIIPLVTAPIIFTGGASCNAAGTLCTLPSESTATLEYSFYTPVPSDPNPLFTDFIATWEDTCDSGAPNCPSGVLTTGGGGSKSYIAWPDLIPEYLDIQGAIGGVFGSGNPLTFSGIIDNRGDDFAEPSKARFRLDINSDGSWDLDQTFFGSPAVARLEAGEGQYVDTVLAPWTAVVGTHKIELCADYEDVVAESQEDNNCVSSTFEVVEHINPWLKTSGGDVGVRGDISVARDLTDPPAKKPDGSQQYNSDYLNILQGSITSEPFTSAKSWLVPNYPNAATPSLDLPPFTPAPASMYKALYDKYTRRCGPISREINTRNSVGLVADGCNIYLHTPVGPPTPPPHNLTINDASWSAGPGYTNNPAVVFVDGNLVIERNIVVGPDTGLIFVVSGDITIDPIVNRVDGFFIFDRNFVTERKYIDAGVYELSRGSWTKQNNVAFPGTDPVAITVFGAAVPVTVRVLDSNGDVYSLSSGSWTEINNTDFPGDIAIDVAGDGSILYTWVLAASGDIYELLRGEWDQVNDVVFPGTDPIAIRAFGGVGTPLTVVDSNGDVYNLAGGTWSLSNDEDFPGDTAIDVAGDRSLGPVVLSSNGDVYYLWRGEWDQVNDVVFPGPNPIAFKAFGAAIPFPAVVDSNGDVYSLAGGIWTKLNNTGFPAGAAIDVAGDMSFNAIWVLSAGGYFDDEQLTINGAAIGAFAPGTKFELKRDLGGDGNKNSPAELINFEPKYLWLFRDIIGDSKVVYREVAP